MPSFKVEMGKVWELFGEKEGAIFYYHEAIEIDKEHPEPNRSFIEQARASFRRLESELKSESVQEPEPDKD